MALRVEDVAAPMGLDFEAPKTVWVLAYGGKHKGSVVRLGTSLMAVTATEKDAETLCSHPRLAERGLVFLTYEVSTQEALSIAKRKKREGIALVDVKGKELWRQYVR